MKFFRLYEYIVPLCLFPLAYVLWLRRYEGDHGLVLFMISIPILFAYIVPGLGTNWLKLWELNASLKLGRFRPHHGFLFGTATSLFVLLCLDFPPRSLGVQEICRSAFVVGSVLAFWNWLYDLLAIRAGYLIVYNRKYHEQKGPEAIASEYCPIFFGTFGFCYGAVVRIGESYAQQGASSAQFGMLFVASNLVVLSCPVVAYVVQSVLTRGETGLQTYEGRNDG